MSRINTLYQLCADADDLQEKPWLTLPEYVLHRLGGRAVAEYTNATHTQLVDAEKRSWSPEIFAAVGLVHGGGGSDRSAGHRDRKIKRRATSTCAPSKGRS